MYINYEYTQTDKIDAVETFHETSLQFQGKDTKTGNVETQILRLYKQPTNTPSSAQSPWPGQSSSGVRRQWVHGPRGASVR